MLVRTGFHLTDGGGGLVAEITPVPRDPHDSAAITAALGCLSVGAPVVSVDNARDTMTARLAPDVARGSASAVLGSIGCLNIDAPNPAF